MKARLLREGFETEAGATRFDRFCSSRAHQAHDPEASEQLLRHADALFVLEPHFENDGGISQGTLLHVLSVEGARRVQPVIDYLIGDDLLAWSEDRSEEAIETGRIEAVLDRAEAACHGPLVRSYLQRLTSAGRARPRAQRTIRQYLAAAEKFLAAQSSEADTRSLATALERYLRREPAQRANLAAFRSFLQAVSGVAIAMPKKRTKSASTKDRELIRKVRDLRARLERATGRAEQVAVAAATISTMHAVPLNEVLRLRQDAVTWRGRSLYLETSKGSLAVARWVSNVLGREFGTEPGFLFPGRGNQRSLTPPAVAYHLQKGEDEQPVGTRGRSMDRTARR